MPVPCTNTLIQYEEEKSSEYRTCVHGGNQKPTQIAPSPPCKPEPNEDRVGLTPEQRAKKGQKSMARRSGQCGYLERKSNSWYVRFWIDVAGQERRAHKSVRICPAKGPGVLAKSEREGGQR